MSSDAFAALRRRDFTLLITAGPLLLTIAVLAQEVALGYALYQRTHDPLTLGLIGLSEAVPYLMVALYGGAVADRLPRKRIVLSSVAVVLCGSTLLFLTMRHADAMPTASLLLAVYATVALVGFVSKVLFSHRIDAVTIWSYVLLGWLPILPGRAYLELVPSAALWWVLAGGLCYTLGTVFLVLDIRRLHFHAIWHLAVLAGSTCHYIAIFAFVACAPTLVP